MEKHANSDTSSSHQILDEADDIFAELARISHGPVDAPTSEKLSSTSLNADYGAAPLRRPPFNGPIEEIIEEAEVGAATPIFAGTADQQFDSPETAMPTSEPDAAAIETPEFAELALVESEGSAVLASPDETPIVTANTQSVPVAEVGPDEFGESAPDSGALTGSVEDAFEFDFGFVNAPATEPDINDEPELTQPVTSAAVPLQVVPSLHPVEPAFAPEPVYAAPEQPVSAVEQQVSEVLEVSAPEQPTLMVQPAEPVPAAPSFDEIGSQIEDSFRASLSQENNPSVPHTELAEAALSADMTDIPGGNQSATMDALENFINDSGDFKATAPIQSAEEFSANPAFHADGTIDDIPTAAVAVPAAQTSTPSPQKKTGGGFWIPALGGVVLIAVAAGAYWKLGPGQTMVEAPVIEAQNTDVKSTPNEPDAQENTIAAATDPSKLIDDIINQETGQGTGIVQENLVVSETADPISGASSSTEQGALTNRKVRTVTVRPDGTILSRNDGTAATLEPLPNVRPVVPTLPDAEAPVAATLVNTPAVETATSDTPTATETTLETTSQPATEDVASAEVAPRPEIKPANISAPAETSAETPTETAAIALVTPPINLTAGTSSHLVQLSSQRTAEVAARSLAEVTRRFGTTLNGANLEILRVDLGERGIFHRVVAAADSADAGNQLCAAIKNAGGDCFVRRR